MTGAKTHPQRERRKDLLSEWRRVKREIVVLDGGKCVVCGKPATAINHVLSRGAWPSLFIDPRNLASLCVEHNSEYANTQDFVRLQFKILQALRPQFDYNELPYSYYLESPTLDKELP